MKLSVLSLDEASKMSVRALGLDDASIALDYPEAIAASLRRAASFLCPTTPRALMDAVLEVLNPVLPKPVMREGLMATLDQLISIGDLLELEDTTREPAARLLYLGPPSFVERSGGRFLVTGVRALGAPLVGSDLTVEYEAHTRTVELHSEGAAEQLRAVGLHEIQQARWIGQPSAIPAHDYVSELQSRLGLAPVAGFVDGLTILDPSTRPTYYRGRWRSPADSDSGDFVGRRPQAYGADLWCFVRLVDGAPTRLLDLPVGQVTMPARDEAWRLQAATDHVNQTPLPFLARPVPGSSPSAAIVDFFSPLPSWVERYLGLTGVSVERSRGALFSYRLPTSALPGLTSVLRETLWMTAATEEEIR